MKLLTVLLLFLMPSLAFALDAGTSTSASGPVSPEQAEGLFAILGMAASAVIAHGWLALGVALVPLTLWVLSLKPVKTALRSDGPIDWVRPLIMAIVTAAAVIMGALSEGVSDVMTIVGSLGGAGIMGYLQKTLQEFFD